MGSLHPLPRKRVGLPLGPNTRLRVRGWGDPMRTTGQKAYTLYTCTWLHPSPQTKGKRGGCQDRSSVYLYFNWWLSYAELYFSVHRGYCSTLPRPVLHTHHKIPHPSSFHQLTHTQSLIFCGFFRVNILGALFYHPSRWGFSASDPL